MSTVPDDDRRGRSPRLVPTGATAIAFVAAVVGLAVSIYLTVEHYNRSVGFACPESSTINCVKVTTSKYAAIAGVPVALLGLLYFAGMAILLVIRSERREVRVLRVVGAAGGVAMALYLIVIELFEVDAICLWCTAVHLMTLVLFGAILWHQLVEQPARSVAH